MKIHVILDTHLSKFKGIYQIPHFLYHLENAQKISCSKPIVAVHVNNTNIMVPAMGINLALILANTIFWIFGTKT